MPLGIFSTISKLKNLRDVSISGISDGETLVYNQADDNFVPGTASGGGGSSVELAVVQGGSSTITAGVVDTSIVSLTSVAAPSNSSQTSTPTWATINGGDPTILTLDSGVYLVQIRIDGSVPGTAEDSFVETHINRTGNSGTDFFKTLGFNGIAQSNQLRHLFDANGDTGFVESYLISLPTAAARRNMRFAIGYSGGAVPSGDGTISCNGIYITKFA
jgi:hypothetical protein